MDADPAALPDDIEALKAALLVERARADAAQSEAAFARAEQSDAQALIVHLKLQIEKLKRELYGQRSESTTVHEVLRALLRLIARVVTLVSMRAAFMISRFEAGKMILSDELGHGAADQLGPRAAVFCHFDKRGEIHDHTRAYIDALRAEGLDIVFVTNAERIAPPDFAWLRGRVARIIIRRNRGYDFAAWRDAMVASSLPAANTRLLLLANDSVYGPLYQLGPVLDRIDFGEADVWSATDSWQHRFHLQSFFVAFGPRAFSHEVFRQFWRSVRNVRSKAWVVKHYEIGLSRSLIVAGLRCKAIWPYVGMIDVLREASTQEEARDRDAKLGATEQVEPPRRNDWESSATSLADTKADWCNVKRILGIASCRKPLNPTADLWRVLIEQGCPFLKRELLRDNPSRVPDVAAWVSVVNEITGFDRDIILRDLEKCLKDCTP